MAKRQLAVPCREELKSFIQKNGTDAICGVLKLLERESGLMMMAFYRDKDDMAYGWKNMEWLMKRVEEMEAEED